MKCTSRRACIDRYGAIDFASAHWPRQSEWMTMVEVPEGMFPHWHVLNTAHPVQHIYCNKDMVEPLWKALQAVKAKGLEGMLHTYDGCLAIRMVRGNNSAFSAHSYGLAIDLDAAHNPMGSRLHTTFSPEFVKCFTDQGFDWGGNFNGRKDPMHFSWAWE
jgi:hypothetical protein